MNKLLAILVGALVPLFVLSGPIQPPLDGGGGGGGTTNLAAMSFTNGTRFANPSNMVVEIVCGTSAVVVVTSDNVSEYVTPGTTYYADPYTMKKVGTTFSVADWIPNNLVELRYELWNLIASQERGLLDGPGYWFSDENGIIAARCTNQVYDAGYQNKVVSGGSGTADCIWKVNYYAGLTSTNEVDSTPVYPFTAATNSAMTFSFWTQLGWDETQWAADYWTVLVGGSGNDFSGRYISAVPGDTPGQLAWGYSSGNHAYWVIGTDSFVHVVFTFDGLNTGKMYTNGVLSATVEDFYFEGPWNAGQAVNIMMDSGSNLRGQQGTILSSVAYWQTNLSAGQVTTLYGLGADVDIGNAPYDSMYVGWKLTGTNVADLADVTGQGFDLVLAPDSADIMETQLITGAAASSADMTLVATNTLLSFVPGYSYMSALLNVGTASVGASNIVLSISRDGTNWTDSTTVMMADSWDVSNKLVSASLAMTNQPALSNVFTKIVVTNGCPIITVKGIAAPCGE